MTIKVGDKVKLKNSPNLERDVLYIHEKPGDGRKFFVVAYMGDIPTSHSEHELTKVPELVTKNYFIDKMEVWNGAHAVGTHKLVVSYLGDKPIAVRLEEI